MCSRWILGQEPQLRLIPWNLFDLFRLFYWALYYPQALRQYLESRDAGEPPRAASESGQSDRGYACAGGDWRPENSGMTSRGLYVGAAIVSVLAVSAFLAVASMAKIVPAWHEGAVAGMVLGWIFAVLMSRSGAVWFDNTGILGAHGSGAFDALRDASRISLGVTGSVVFAVLGSILAASAGALVQLTALAISDGAANTSSFWWLVGRQTFQSLLLITVTAGVGAGVLLSVAGGVISGTRGALTVITGLRTVMRFGLVQSFLPGLALMCAFSLTVGIGLVLSEPSSTWALDLSFDSRRDSALHFLFDSGVFAALIIAMLSGVVWLLSRVFALSFFLGGLRLDAALVSGVVSLYDSRYWGVSNVSVMPAKLVRSRVEGAFAQSWDQGMSLVRTLLRQSLQVLPVWAGICFHGNRGISRICPGEVFSLALCDEVGAKIMRASSLPARSLMSLSILRANVNVEWKPGASKAPAFAHWCMAAYHLWQRDAESAQFELLGLQSELSGCGQSFAAFVNSAVDAANCRSLEQIAEWREPDLQGTEPWIANVVRVLRRLGYIVEDAREWCVDRDSRLAQKALTRLIIALNVDEEAGLAVVSRGSIGPAINLCTEPMRGVLFDIATAWARAVKDAAQSHLMQGPIPQRLANPYIVGGLVPADRLVGRAREIEKVADWWRANESGATVFLSGPRRVGKTSLVKHLNQFGGFADARLVYICCQIVSTENALASVCFHIASGLFKQGFTGFLAEDARGIDDPTRHRFTTSPVQTLHEFIGSCCVPGSDRCLVILDEFEVLFPDASDCAVLAESEAMEFAKGIRATIAMHRWITFAFVGLREPGSDLRIIREVFVQPYHVEVPVFDFEGCRAALCVDLEDFPVEYTEEAVVACFRLTGGQPFLVQALGDALVHSLNQQIAGGSLTLPYTVEAKDVAELEQGGYLLDRCRSFLRALWDSCPASVTAQCWETLAERQVSLSVAELEMAVGHGQVAVEQSAVWLARHGIVHSDGDVLRWRMGLAMDWVRVVHARMPSG
jgi:hypothetical protein